MQSFYLFAVIVALANQVFALNVQLGGALGNLTAGQLLDFGSEDSFVSQVNCNSQCQPAFTKLTCGQSDSCSCTNDTGMAMLSCEQCLFTEIVNRNIPAPNPLMGSQSTLDAFVAACKASNVTVMPLKMTIPPSMHGPQSNKLSTPAAAVAVTVAGLLGGGLLYMFSTLE